MMVGDLTLPIENASGASLLQLQYAAKHCHEEGQCLMTIFLVDGFRLHCIPPHKEIELQHGLHIWRETLLFRHVYVLTTCSEFTSAM